MLASLLLSVKPNLLPTKAIKKESESSVMRHNNNNSDIPIIVVMMRLGLISFATATSSSFKVFSAQSTECVAATA
jgi:hypothetical protein